MIFVEQLKIVLIGILLQVTSDTDMISVGTRSVVTNSIVDLLHTANGDGGVAARVDIVSAVVGDNGIGSGDRRSRFLDDTD